MTDFQTIFETYNKQLVYFAKQLVGETYAEDLVADAFLKLWNAKDWSNPKAFLYTVIRNDCVNLLKHSILKETTHEQIAYVMERWESLEIKSDLLGKIWKQVETLAPRERRVIKYFYEHDFSVKEIASTLGISVDTVRVLKFRALQKLRLKFK